MFSVMNSKEIIKAIKGLTKKGLKENIDFRVVYFSNQAELKML